MKISKISACVIVGIVLVGLTVSIGGPEYLKQKTEKLIGQQCPTCLFEIDNVQINPFKGILLFHFISFASDPNEGTVVKAHIDELAINIDLMKLLRHEVHIEKLKLSGLKVVVEEKYNPNPPPPKPGELSELESSYGGKWMEILPEALVDNISIYDSSLEYILKKFGKDARITISKINAEISPLGTRKDLSPRFTDVNLKGQILESGLLTFKCRADLFSVKNEDEIEIDVQNQKMSELDSLFVNEDGVELSGEINEAHAHVTLTQGQLSGDLWAHYTDLSLHFMPTPETGKIKTLITNILQSIKIAKTKPVPKKPLPVATVSYMRQPGQGLIKFILQGLKEAAFKVISN